MGGEDNRFSDVLSMLMKNPELLRGFASMLGGMNGGTGMGTTANMSRVSDEEAGHIAESDVETADSRNTQSGGDRLSEIIDSVIAEDRSRGRAGEAAGQPAPSDTGPGADNPGVAAGAFGVSGTHGTRGGKRQFPVSGDKRLALLVALKPYLSPRRAAAVDGMVRFGKIGELLEGFLPGNGGK